MDRIIREVKVDVDAFIDKWREEMLDMYRDPSVFLSANDILAAYDQKVITLEEIGAIDWEECKEIREYLKNELVIAKEG